MGDYGWVRTGSRRSRGSSRGRGSTGLARHGDEPSRDDTYPKDGPTRGHGAVNSNIRSTRGGRGGSHAGGVMRSKDGSIDYRNAYPMAEDSPLVTNPYGGMVKHPSGSPQRRVPPMMAITPGHPPVGDPLTVMDDSLPLPRLTATPSSDHREEASDKPRLITSRSKENGHERSKQVEDHEILVDRVSLTILSPDHHPPEDIHAMESEGPDDEIGPETFDDDMPLALVQKEDPIFRETGSKIQRELRYINKIEREALVYV
ncbi:hypothetical protein J5N97_025278 [Dioscorea zingiberensis]|uniref:Uncharacterized protein n=1 Tax=Dioscorea zingiberensis TaxID=325984 RepID=A0A9D5C887_9LILI|nr:hypothetical protein J5N97_025278 [Dioscorea zingiberensis]